MTLCDVNEMFGTDQRCRELLKRLRWPAGVECPRCHDKRVSWINTQQKFECSDCQYQFSITSNTIFHDSHLPLVKWFLATLLLCESRKGHSANQIKRELGISYKTAWYLCHRIRAAMRAARPMLDGTVEMDETYIGGVKRGGRGPHASEKEIVIGLRQRGGDLRFFHASDTTSGTLAKFIKDNVSKDVELMVTDELQAYPRAMMAAGIHGTRHKTIKHKDRVYVQGNVHTNTVESSFSLLKRGIVGTWHKISAKHLQAYLNEMCFRFDRRNDPDLFIDTLRHMVTADPLTFENLIAGKKPKYPVPPTTTQQIELQNEVF